MILGSFLTRKHILADISLTRAPTAKSFSILESLVVGEDNIKYGEKGPTIKKLWVVKVLRGQKRPHSAIVRLILNGMTILITFRDFVSVHNLKPSSCCYERSMNVMKYLSPYTPYQSVVMLRSQHPWIR